MIIISKGSIEEFVRKEVGKMGLLDRLNLNLYGRYYDKETIYSAGFRSGQAVTLPLDGIWKKDHDGFIESIYTTTLDDKEKNRQLRQVDRVLVHTSPEGFGLERRVCYPGEILSFGSHNENGKIPPSNKSHCVSEDKQYQIIISQTGNMVVRTVEQYEFNTNPRIRELCYINAGNFDDQEHVNINARRAFLINILEKLPYFNGVNLLTDREHGREIRIVSPSCQHNLVYESLKEAEYKLVPKGER